MIEPRGVEEAVIEAVVADADMLRGDSGGGARERDSGLVDDSGEVGGEGDDGDSSGELSSEGGSMMRVEEFLLQRLSRRVAQDVEAAQ